MDEGGDTRHVVVATTTTTTTDTAEDIEPIVVMGEGAYGCVFRFKNQQDSVIKIQIYHRASTTTTTNKQQEEMTIFDNEIKIYDILSVYKRKGLLHANADIGVRGKMEQLPKNIHESLKGTKFYNKNKDLIENPSGNAIFQLLYMERIDGRDLSHLYELSFSDKKRISRSLIKSLLFQKYCFSNASEIFCRFSHCDEKPSNLKYHQQWVKEWIVFDFNPFNKGTTKNQFQYITTNHIVGSRSPLVSVVKVPMKRKVWMVPIPDGRVVRVFDFGFSKAMLPSFSMDENGCIDESTYRRSLNARVKRDGNTGKLYLSFTTNHEQPTNGFTPVYGEPDIVMNDLTPKSRFRTEMFNKRKCDCDIWASGLIALEMVMCGLRNEYGIESNYWPIGGCMDLKTRNIIRQPWHINPKQRNYHHQDIFDNLLHQSLNNYCRMSGDPTLNLHLPRKSMEKKHVLLRNKISCFLETCISQCLILRALGHPPLSEYKYQFSKSIFYEPLSRLSDQQLDLLDSINVCKYDADTGTQRVDRIMFYTDIVIPRIEVIFGTEGFEMIKSMLSRTQSERLISPQGRVGGFFNIIDSSFFEEFVVKESQLLSPEEYKSNSKYLYYSIPDYTTIELEESDPACMQC